MVRCEKPVDVGPNAWPELHNIWRRYVDLEILYGKDHCVYEFDTSGYCQDVEELKRVFNIEGNGGKLVERRVSGGGSGFTSDIWRLEDNCWVYVEWHGENNVSVQVMTTQHTLFNYLKKKFSSLIGESSSGFVGVINMTPNGPQPVSLGSLSCGLERDNYSNVVVNWFDYIRDNLVKDKPYGRLTVLTGPPGTGKSYWLRGLISEVEANWLYVPSSVASRLTSPELIGLLAHLSRDIPNILIVEDADRLLTRRGPDNMSSISDILNISDGIIGELSNLHVVATTNAHSIEMDVALKRPGRLAALVEFDMLGVEQANSVAKRLGVSATINSPKTLAEIYELTHEKAISEINKSIPKAGF